MRDNANSRHLWLRKWLAIGLVFSLGLVWGGSVFAQGISGTINNVSTWKNLSPPFGLGPRPGDGSGSGQIGISVMSADATVASLIITNGVLPIGGVYDYSFPGPFPANVAYTVVAWVDGDSNGVYDFGEPKGEASVTFVTGASVVGKRVNITDDFDKDALPDWWETHWFFNEVNPLAFTGASDPDGDGLSNLEEYQLSVTVTNGVFPLALLNPADWDSDGDKMDDGWECRYFDPTLLTGMDATVSNTPANDFDGDGLSDWQEYCGVDGYPRMVFDQFVDSITRGKLNPQAIISDDLNPIDIDTDFDMLLDSFEAAWYDPANRIDPRVGILSGVPALGVAVDTTLAQEDSDRDGLSNFREQCLLGALHQSSTNGWLWNWSGRVPFAFHPYTFQGKTYRLCTMVTCGGQALNFGLDMSLTIPDSANRASLRAHEWTDPTEGTGYAYTDEVLSPGHDTDNDGLPDGWEVQFGLDPRNDGFDGTWTEGPFGDPDGDGLMNIDEFFGQDGNRSASYSYINGTGDETNPNFYHWRVDSTYQWRWINTNVTATTASSEREIGDPRTGMGISRRETLGGALPSTNVWTSMDVDGGYDSDDDGIPDAIEVSPTNSVLPSSPVDSCDPFIPKSARIINPNGIAIPDPEPETSANSAGWRPDLQRRDWTLECQVKLLATNLTGNLFNFQTTRGPRLCTVFRLSLSNNAPVLVSDNPSYNPVMVFANPLPANRWVHLAAVWDHKNNNLGLYIDGVLSLSPLKLTESFSVYMQSASNRLMLAESPNGSFTNMLLDEVRIWGLARTSGQINEYAHKLVPSVNGDDVWIHQTDFDTILVNGGGIFEREPGVPLTNVYQRTGSYWIDDGDGQYDATRDVLLMNGSNVFSGMTGGKVDNVFWNDKDHSGDFTRNSLLAYYRFDDGGSSAEDFARRAKSGLLRTTAEDYRYGDRGYALPTNSFLFVTNEPAKVYGVDQRGADDSDSDGLPDAWELIHGLDLWEDGTRGESSPGAKDGPHGAKGDPDKDGLINIYEFWAGTNPRFADSDGDGVLDVQEDRDEDGVLNIIEQLQGSRPDMVDTDDDGFADNEEQSAGTSPINAVDPATNSLAVVFAGGSGDYLEIPLNVNQRMPEWTLEAWAMPSNVTDGAGVIVRRVVENLAGGTQAVNYVMGLEPNGVGGLRLYAGYIWPDGRQYLVRGGTVPPSVWTHLVASYSKSSAALTLYTNGVLAASTNSFYDGPPVSGRGGEAFVRIGEDFGGAIDEVRLWNIVRTPTQIQTNTNRVISASDTNGLVNYFRFDDGQAVTNSLNPVWTVFHQPAGFQDFTYDDDWNAQWRHAAIQHGNVGTRLGAIISPPSLRVMLQPDEAIVGGAQWSLDGGTWQNSGVSLQRLDAGPHMVMFKEVAGWTAPNSLSLTLTNGRAMTTNGVYVQKAALKVSFNNDPVLPLAAWQVNGGTWMTNGMTLTNLNAGANLVSYREVPGYIQPPSETVTLIPGQTLALIRPYTIMTATISAIITPSAAAAVGARWQVDGGTVQVSGAAVGGLAMTTHQVSFTALSRWITPATISVTPTNQIAIVVTGVYSQVSGLAVDLLPAEAVATGAQWRISGGEWTNSGTLLPLPAGSYTVEFKPVNAGWLAPGSQTVLVTNQSVAELSATYLKADVFGGPIGTNAGEFYLPHGLDSDPLHRLYVADTYNDRIQMYDALSQLWTNWGKFGTNLGQFKKPSGLAVDKLGNLFVADQSNHRIQKRVATNGLWVSVGSNTLVSGSALGQFNGPADVAVDSALNLYVADTWNHRVQKFSTSQVWSVFVTNGPTVGKVQYPQGLHIDSADNLYVSDDGTQTNGLNRIQKFSKTGQYLGLLGGRDASQGSLQDPGGMTIGNGNLYVANNYDSRVAYSDMTGLTWTTLVGSNVLSHPGDVEWDPRGYLYIADTSHNRILIVQVDPAAATNGLTQLTAMTSSGTNTSFTLTWFARLNWNYAVQYANTLAPSPVWLNLPGYSAITGLDMMTNCTDTTVLGVTNRFYRIIAY
jgi:hypothetical protein